jgi:drug/metabolite transporter (DMT)-like permease
MDVLMGLLAALMWGGTDVLVGLNARAVGVRRAVFFSQAIALLLLSLWLLVFPQLALRAFEVPLQVWLLGVLAALLAVAGALMLAQAFVLGKAAIISPLVTLYGLFTTLLSWATGEQLSLVQFSIICLCVFGVLLTSVQPRAEVAGHPRMLRSIICALGAAALYGASFWLQGRYTLVALGPVPALWLVYLVGVLGLSFSMLRSAHGLRLPALKLCAPLVLVSVLNLGGFLAFSYGALAGSVSVVTVISTLSGGIATVLAYLVFKEKLSWVQVLGVGLVLVGAFALHLN